MWPCGNVEGGDKENSNCVYTVAMAKRKRGNNWYGRDNDYFSFCHFNIIYTIFWVLEKKMRQHTATRMQKWCFLPSVCQVLTPHTVRKYFSDRFLALTLCQREPCPDKGEMRFFEEKLVAKPCITMIYPSCLQHLHLLTDPPWPQFLCIIKAQILHTGSP